MLGASIPTDTQTVMPRRPQPEGGHLWACLRCHTLSLPPTPKKADAAGARDEGALSPHAVLPPFLSGPQTCNQSLKGVDPAGLWHTRKYKPDSGVVDTWWLGETGLKGTGEVAPLENRVVWWLGPWALRNPFCSTSVWNWLLTPVSAQFLTFPESHPFLILCHCFGLAPSLLSGECLILFRTVY